LIIAFSSINSFMCT